MNDIRDPIDLTGFYRTFFPNIVKYAFFTAHETFSKNDSCIKMQSKSEKYRKIKVTICILSDINVLNLETNSKRNYR